MPDFRRIISIHAVFFILFLSGAVSGANLLPGFQEEIVVFGLKNPILAEYAPDGRLFIIEKAGTIRIFKNGALLPKPFLRVNVNDLSERGLLGFAFDPDFEINQYVYIYRTNSNEVPENHVERFKANGDQVVPDSRKVLIKGIRTDTGQHNAGCIRFGPDKKLYISAGDGGHLQDLAQDFSSLNGKILRINPDGTIPLDNPFLLREGARPEIWALGLRNPFRFAIHPHTGVLVIGDVGSNRFEEINVGRKGGNYGWPSQEGPSTATQFISPAYSYEHVLDRKDAAIIAGTFYTAKKFPESYFNKFFFTDYVRGFIKTLEFDSAGNVVKLEDFAHQLTGPVYLLQGKDGSLMYVSIREGEVRKIKYVGGNNRPPIAEASASRVGGPVPLRVNFSSSGTKDPDGDSLQYLWDFGDGNSSAHKNPSHIYAEKGIYFAILRVLDGHGGKGESFAVRIAVGNELPIITITKPLPGRIVSPGEVVQFSGKAIDPEDGPVPPNRLTWRVDLHHNQHTHPFIEQLRGTSGSFRVPDSHEDGDLFFRIYLEATDSANLSKTAFVDVTFEQ